MPLFQQKTANDCIRLLRSFLLGSFAICCIGVPPFPTPNLSIWMLFALVIPLTTVGCIKSILFLALWDVSISIGRMRYTHLKKKKTSSTRNWYPSLNFAKCSDSALFVHPAKT